MAQSEKDRLIYELALARQQLSEGLTGLKHDLEFGRRFRQSYARQPAGWLAGSAAAGWLLSRLPARRKKVVISKARRKKSKGNGTETAQEADEQVRKTGCMLGLMQMAFAALRPAITAFVKHQVTDFVGRRR